MIVICVYIRVIAEFTNDFVEATTQNHLETIKEPGNLRFDLIQQAEDPCRFMLYEAWESDEAAAYHKTTAHYARWRDTVTDWMAEPRYGVKHNIIQPNDRSQW
jgi:(4S)-4-hydroxy-5-phosphonooxypentane-2,3-dione isomerase